MSILESQCPRCFNSSLKAPLTRPCSNNSHHSHSHSHLSSNSLSIRSAGDVRGESVLLMTSQCQLISTLSSSSQRLPMLTHSSQWLPTLSHLCNPINSSQDPSQLLSLRDLVKGLALTALDLSSSSSLCPSSNRDLARERPHTLPVLSSNSISSRDSNLRDQVRELCHTLCQDLMDSQCSHSNQWQLWEVPRAPDTTHLLSLVWVVDLQVLANLTPWDTALRANPLRPRSAKLRHLLRLRRDKPSKPRKRLKLPRRCHLSAVSSNPACLWPLHTARRHQRWSRALLARSPSHQPLLVIRSPRRISMTTMTTMTRRRMTTTTMRTLMVMVMTIMAMSTTMMRKMTTMASMTCLERRSKSSSMDSTSRPSPSNSSNSNSNLSSNSSNRDQLKPRDSSNSNSLRDVAILSNNSSSSHRGSNASKSSVDSKSLCKLLCSLLSSPNSSSNSHFSRRKRGAASRRRQELSLSHL